MTTSRSKCCKYTGTPFPIVDTSGCIVGNGQPSDPIRLKLDPSGNLFCDDSGLYVSGIITSITVSGCLEGDGTPSAPLLLTINPDGGLECGPSGLQLSSTDASGCCTVFSYEDGAAPSGASSPTSPTFSPVQGTVQQEVWNDCIRYWTYISGVWVLDKEFCGGGSGDEDCTSERRPVRTISSSDTALLTDKYILADTSGSNIVVTLQDPTSAFDSDCSYELTVKWIDSSNNVSGRTMSLSTPSGVIVGQEETPNASSSFPYIEVGESANLISDGVNWYIV